MQIIVLGSGTSHGVPMIGCRCPVCTSSDPRNRRTRTSAAVRLGTKTVLIDTSPELRLQAVANGIDRIDAVVYTHSHADHVMGFDELRRFAKLNRKAIPVYASPATLGDLYRIFPYAVTDEGVGSFGVPIVQWHALAKAMTLEGHRITPVWLEHGGPLTVGIRIDAPDGAALAWCPDCSGIPAAAREQLRGLDVLFLDGLRYVPYPSHLTVAEAIERIRDLAPRRAFLIHMTHDLDHEKTERALPNLAEVPGGIRLAYDGLVMDVTR